METVLIKSVIGYPNYQVDSKWNYIFFKLYEHMEPNKNSKHQ